MRLLGVRFLYVQGEEAAKVANGGAIPSKGRALYERRRSTSALEMCACTAGVRPSCEGPADGETVAVIADNKLVALYAFDGARGCYAARCVFQTGVSRGRDI